MSNKSSGCFVRVSKEALAQLVAAVLEIDGSNPTRLARQANGTVSAGTIRNVLQGRYESMRLATLEGLADALDLTLANVLRVACNGEVTKTCGRCKETLPLDAFGTAWDNKHRRYQALGRCRPCQAAHMREVRAANPQRHRDNAKRHRERYPEKVKARQDRWKAENREHVRRRLRAYYEKNKARLVANGAARRGATTVVEIDPETILKRDAFTCYLCLRQLQEPDLTLDHVVPLLRGGQHTPDNVRTACWHCNNRKRNQLIEELHWLTDERKREILASLKPAP